MACSNGKTDGALGVEVANHLVELGLETVNATWNKTEALIALKTGIRGFLRNMGLDVSGDPSIKDTPDRVAEMYTNELCYGLDYSNFPKCTVTPNGTPKTKRVPKHDGYADETYYIGRVDEMVLVRNLQTISLCEHHFQSIHGVTHIAYIPHENLLGVSKFGRVTNFFARRPQVQERMTEQLFAALCFILKTKDVAVHQVAAHNCMRHRGIMEPNSDMITSKMGGRFMTVPALRQEFLNSIPKGN